MWSKKNLHRYLVTATVLLSLVFGARQELSAESDVQTFLSAPVWYLEFEVSFRVSYEDTARDGIATTVTTISLDRTFSAKWPLDMRNDGPSPVLGASFVSVATDGKAPTVAEQMKMANDLMARMSSAANWMSTGGALSMDENATEEESAAAMEAGTKAAMGPAKLEYLRVDIGKNLLDEMGGRNDQTTRTTRKGTGPVLAGGGQGVTFEIDGAAKTYALVIPLGFNDMNTKYIGETVTTTVPAGSEPIVTKSREEIGLELFPRDLKVDDAKNLLGGMALIRGELDLAADKVSGERSYGAQYTDSNTPVPGTMRVRFSLSMTPPTKPTGTGK